MSEQVRKKLKVAMQENARLSAELEKMRRCFQGEKDWVLMEPGEHARLMKEIETLKGEPDALTAYLYADTLRRDDIKRLKHQIKSLTKAGDALSADVLFVFGKNKDVEAWEAAKEGKQS